MLSSDPKPLIFWSSPLRFFLVGLGALAGVDTFSEFPYLLIQYGGAAFVMVYGVMLLGVAWPLLAAQLAMGKRWRCDVLRMGTMRNEQARVQQVWRWTGLAAVFGGFLVYSYIAVFAGWMMAYAFEVACGVFHGASVALVRDHFADFIAHPLHGLLWDAAFLSLTLVVAAVGPAAIEDLARFVVPGILATLLGLAAYGATRGSFFLSAPALFGARSQHLGSAGLLIALSQAFFGPGLGTAAFIAYGVYLPTRISAPRLALGLVLAQAALAWLGGFAFASIAFAAGLKPLAGGGFLFETLPLVSERLAWGVPVVSLAYLVLIASAWLSMVAWLEPLLQIAESRGLARSRAALGLGLLALAIGVVVILSLNSWAFSFTFFGRVKTLGLLDILMILAVNVLLPWGGGGLAALMGWTRDGHAEGCLGRLWGQRLWLWSLRVTIPVAVLIIFFNAPG